MVNGASASGMGNGGNANNASSSTSENAGGAQNNGGTFADQNPFLAAREAQRMVKNYPDDDVGRQSLEQLNEISRRATVAGMSFSNTNGRPGTPARVLTGLLAQNQANRAGINGEAHRRQSTSPASSSRQQQQQDSPTHARQQEQNQEQNQSSSSNADVANLNLSREDALQRIEELARARPSSAQGGGANGVIGPLGPIGLGGGLGMGASVGQGSMQLPSVQYASGNDPFIMPGNEAGIGGGAMDPYGNANGTNMAMSMGMGAGGGMGNHALTHSGLQVFTLGHLMPRSSAEDDNNAVWSFDARGQASGSGAGQQGVQQQQDQQGSGMVGPYGGIDGAQAGSSTGIGTSEYASSSMDPSGATPIASSRLSRAGSSPTGGSQKLRVRRSTFVPGWAVPPRVLLVDDDAVSRKLSSKFLQVFGCTIDVAVDGVVAVNKMNLERYDLVLMVGLCLN